MMYHMEYNHLNKYLEYLKYQSTYSNDTLINYYDAREYLKYLYEELNEEVTTVSRKISSLRSYYKFLAKNKIVSSNVFELVTLPKKKKKLPSLFAYDELQKLFDVPDKHTPLGQRDSLILEMLYATGIRVSELVNIKINDITLSNNS